MTGLQLPVALGDCILLEPLSEGPLTGTYLAVQGSLLGGNHFCAVKVIRFVGATAQDDIERYKDAARHVLHLTHRNICQVFEIGHAEDFLFVGMEFVFGQDLLSVLRRLETRRDCLEPPVAIYMMREILEALDYAHRFRDPFSQDANEIVHADLNPRNILISYSGEPRLLGFGGSTSAPHEPHIVPYDPCYASPERMNGETLDGRTDQYSAAVVLAELLVGRRFHEGMSLKAQIQGTAVSKHRPPGYETLEPSLRAILDRALSAEPDERYPTCADFADALADYQLEYRHRVHTGVLRDKMQEIFEPEIREESVHLGDVASALEGSNRSAAPRPDVHETIELISRPLSDTASDSGMAVSRVHHPTSQYRGIGPEASTQSSVSGETSSAGQEAANSSLDELFAEPTVQAPPAVHHLARAPGSTVGEVLALEPSTDPMRDSAIPMVDLDDDPFAAIDALRRRRGDAQHDEFEEDTIVDPQAFSLSDGSEED